MPKLQKIEGPQFVLDLRYNTENNFLHKNVYEAFKLDQCFVRPELESKLQKASEELARRKLKLVFFDCFRPLSVQRAMWELVPDARYVANPDHGSNHNRGTAVDVTLANEDGSYLSMPTEFDDFTEKAATNAPCVPSAVEACKNRDLLRQILTDTGLVVLKTEWWHFQLPDAGKYPLIETYNAEPAK